MAKRSATQNQTNIPDSGFFSLKFWATAIKELGIPAFIVLFFTMLFLFVSTKEQKQAFINEFFLFKDINNNPFPFAFVLLCLFLIILFQYLYYNKILKIKNDENARLGNEKTELQQQILNRKLNSSQR